MLLCRDSHRPTYSTNLIRNHDLASGAAPNYA